MATPSGPRIPTHGAVDLSALKAPQARPAPAATSAAAERGGNPFVVEVNEENFATEVMATSMQVPVVIDFWAGWCQPCKQLAPIMEKLAAEYDGRFVLATIDTDANQRLASEIGIQSLPTVMAVVGQQPVPLFQGALPEAQVRQYIEELLRVAAANGVTGRVAPRDGAAPVAEVDREPELPHAEAYELMIAGDLEGAEAAYSAALAHAPADADAAAGLARVGLLRRVQGVDPDVALKSAAQSPSDLAAQLLAADVEVASGQPDAAFARLIGQVRVTGGADRDAVRERLLSLFLVLGADDPRVGPARRALASALF